ncbi:MAG: hypothetical protein ACYC6A_24210 [Armatimonadota bacterium]
MPEEFISATRAATLLNVSTVRVWVMAQAGQIAWQWRNGREKEYLLADVERLASTERKAGRPKKKEEVTMRLELTPDQYRELCHRIGRAVLAMHQTRQAWFNGIYHGKGAPKEGMSDVCAFDDERVPKWLQRVIEQEGESIMRGYADMVGCHYPEIGEAASRDVPVYERITAEGEKIAGEGE